MCLGYSHTDHCSLGWETSSCLREQFTGEAQATHLSFFSQSLYRSRAGESFSFTFCSAVQSTFLLSVACLFRTVLSLAYSTRISCCWSTLVCSFLPNDSFSFQYAQSSSHRTRHVSALFGLLLRMSSVWYSNRRTLLLVERHRSIWTNLSCFSRYHDDEKARLRQLARHCKSLPSENRECERLFLSRPVTSRIVLRRPITQWVNRFKKLGMINRMPSINSISIPKMLTMPSMGNILMDALQVNERIEWEMLSTGRCRTFRLRRQLNQSTWLCATWHLPECETHRSFRSLE